MSAFSYISNTQLLVYHLLPVIIGECIQKSLTLPVWVPNVIDHRVNAYFEVIDSLFEDNFDYYRRQRHHYAIHNRQHSKIIHTDSLAAEHLKGQRKLMHFQL